MSQCKLYRYVLVLGLVVAGVIAHAQVQDSIIQFSGTVLTLEEDELVAVPLINILIEKSGRGTYSDENGFFSVVAEVGDVVRFSGIGYETVRMVIPDTLTSNRYTIFQVLPQDTILLPETVIYPWPSREHFKIEFLAMEIPDELQDIADINLASVTMARLRESVLPDGVETSSFYLRRQADSYYSFGQAKPMNILSPLAWAKFFKAWKNGDFKRKKSDF